MKKVFDFLKEVGTYFLATDDDGQPRVRPFGSVNIYDGKLYIQTGKKKDVSKQIHKNPKAEICAFKDGKWLRLTCELIEDERVEAKKINARRLSVSARNVRRKRRKHGGVLLQKRDRGLLRFRSAV